jgi:hypothetical protein
MITRLSWGKLKQFAHPVLKDKQSLPTYSSFTTMLDTFLFLIVVLMAEYDYISIQNPG